MKTSVVSGRRTTDERIKEFATVELRNVIYTHGVAAHLDKCVLSTGASASVSAEGSTANPHVPLTATPNKRSLRERSRGGTSTSLWGQTRSSMKTRKGVLDTTSKSGRSARTQVVAAVQANEQSFE